MAVNMTAQPKERFGQQVQINPTEPNFNILSRSTNEFDIKSNLYKDLVPSNNVA